MIKVRVIIFILALLLWLLLVGLAEPQYLLLGVAVAGFISFFTADIFKKSPDLTRRPIRYLWFFYYLPVFLWECLKANLEGAYKVIHPDLPIRPGIVKVKTTLKSDTAITFLANSLTLKPGTMTVDVDKENGFLYVHWADVESQDVERATELIALKFERILKKVFE